MSKYKTLDELIKAFHAGEFGRDGQLIKVESDDIDASLVRVTCAENKPGEFEIMFEGRVKGGYGKVVQEFGPSFGRKKK